MSARPSRLLFVLLAMVLLVVACTPSQPPVPPDHGLVDQATWHARQRAYLQHATRTLTRGNPESLIANLSRSAAEPDFRIDAREFTAADLRVQLQRIDTHVDTSDFDLMRLFLLWRTQSERLDPKLSFALRQRLLGFRYWYDDPRPGGMIDHKWFWSENHRIIVHTLEYLAGGALPDERFTITGQPGRAHAERGRQRVLGWLDEKARWGFSEWHSDVYYPEDIQALLLLTEFAEPEVADRATAMLDVFFADLATHQLRGNFGATHGRSYMKDKSRAADQNTRDLVHFLFDSNPAGYSEHVDFGTLMLATGTRYRLPVAIQRLAHTPTEFTDRQRMGVPIDPTLPVSADPVAPPGTSFAKPEDVAFWWDRGAMTAWQVVPISLRLIREQELWRTQLFEQLRPLFRQQGTADTEGAQHVAYALGCQVNAGLLSEVNTVTWRGPRAMLSSVQDYRPGCVGRQYHAWQATLSPDAVVFTTHPGNPDRARANGGRWVDDDLYWNGGLTMPRTAQSGRALISIYAPRFPAGREADQAEANYLPMTHAFLPTQHFDEVRQVGGWTVARSGDGYVGLWSQRPTRWAPVAPNPAGLNRPYDLVADGGADNVWITEVGSREQYGSFDAFVRALERARVEAVPRGVANGVAQGFDVTYHSPAEGRLAFGSSGLFTVDGRMVDQHSGPRAANPFVRAESGTGQWRIDIDGAQLELDLFRGTRVARLN
ncbi:hypothetical protein CGZ93_05560 [Enemella dayhoffiae]|uniref:Heparin-sulfate lyase N-terminal domain-containing protein n=1 Tax=Enemella dayhoffiae TaxID=2016507 RepID=A0A255H8D3_9ACTN|nr:hypothetical protein [Enemella dayhoffiae]OYO23970.1 hypothetical protein CGZ93_05560 [Enemella dayhoffiae]